MPLPSPRKKEKKSEFVSRCVSELSSKDEFNDAKQRVAVCYDIFKKKESKANIIIGEGGIPNSSLMIRLNQTKRNKKRC